MVVDNFSGESSDGGWRWNGQWERARVGALGHEGAISRVQGGDRRWRKGGMRMVEKRDLLISSSSYAGGGKGKGWKRTRCKRACTGIGVPVDSNEGHIIGPRHMQKKRSLRRGRKVRERSRLDELPSLRQGKANRKSRVHSSQVPLLLSLIHI